MTRPIKVQCRERIKGRCVGFWCPDPGDVHDKRSFCGCWFTCMLTGRKVRCERVAKGEG